MADSDERELKTIKFQMMLSPGEAKEIDDWSFSNRIRSRAEAIRRLCQIGIHASEQHKMLETQSYDLLAKLVDYAAALNKAKAKGPGFAELSSQVGDFLNDVSDLAMKIGAMKDGEFPLEEGMDEVEWIRQHSESRVRLVEQLKPKE